jgi:hypothetical protein
MRSLFFACAIWIGAASCACAQYLPPSCYPYASCYHPYVHASAHPRYYARASRLDGGITSRVHYSVCKCHFGDKDDTPTCEISVSCNTEGGDCIGTCPAYTPVVGSRGY